MAEELPDTSDFPDLPPLETPGADVPDFPGAPAGLDDALSIEFPAAGSEELQRAIAAFPDFPSHPPFLDASGFPEVAEVVGAGPSEFNFPSPGTLERQFADFPDFPAAAPVSGDLADFFPGLQPGLGREGQPNWPEGARMPQGEAQWPPEGPQGPGQGGFPGVADYGQVPPGAMPDAAGYPGADAGGFPDLAGGQQELPDSGIMDVLGQILAAVSGGQQGQAGRNGFRHFDPDGPLQWPWSGGGGETPESLEEYPAGSPSVDVTSLSGARGAGGWGFGSRTPGGSSTDFLDPGRRRVE